MPTYSSHLVQRFLAKHQITQVTQLPYNPHLVPYDFFLVQKLKSPLKWKTFQTLDEIQKNMSGLLMAIGRTVWDLKVPPLKWTEAPLSYVQCFLYPVSSLVNVSILHITWLGTFWTDFLSCIKEGPLSVLYFPALSTQRARCFGN